MYIIYYVVFLNDVFLSLLFRHFIEVIIVIYKNILFVSDGVFQLRNYACDIAHLRAYHVVMYKNYNIRIILYFIDEAT